MAIAVGGLAVAAYASGEFALFGLGADAVGFLEIVNFAVEFKSVAELVAGNQSAALAAPYKPVTKPVTYFAVKGDWAELCHKLNRQVVLGTIRHDSSAHGAGGVVD